MYVTYIKKFQDSLDRELIFDVNTKLGLYRKKQISLFESQIKTKLRINYWMGPNSTVRIKVTENVTNRKLVGPVQSETEYKYLYKYLIRT